MTDHATLSAERERREFSRYESSSIESSIDFDQLIEVNVRDLSRGGMAFDTAERPGVGRSYTVRLQLGREKLTVRGRVVWSHIAATTASKDGDCVAVYRAGIRFEPVLGPEMEGVLQKLEQQAFITRGGASSDSKGRRSRFS